jgi:hypothetical protein
MRTTALITILILMASCNIKKQRNHNEYSIIYDSIKTDLDYTANNLGKGKSINMQEFLKNANALITSILGKGSEFKVVSDTLKHSNSNSDNDIKDLENFIFKKSNRTLRHFLVIDPPNDQYSLYILEAHFISKKSLDSVFINLKYLANEDRRTPGLTYSNDQIYRYQNYLIWVHSRCIYSYQNHNRFAKLIQGSFNTEAIIDSLKCKCGAIKCE